MRGGEGYIEETNKKRKKEKISIYSYLLYNTYEYIDRIVNNYGDKRNLVGHKGKTDHISRDSRTETVVGYI